MKALLFAASLAALSPALPAQDAPPAPLSIRGEALGDSGEQVAMQIVFTFDPALVAEDAPLVLQGSLLSGGTVVRNFRRPLAPDERATYTMVALMPVGPGSVEARLLAERADTPLLLARQSLELNVAKTGTEYAAAETAEADAILAEGVVPESAGSVKIKPPRRDLAPNLFIVEVDVKAPVRRVEFWVDGRKIQTRNAPPYRAELDLGALPQRVEVRAVGYDARGRYIDADAWLVNERENALEVKLTRTDTPDGVAHFRVNVQNPKAQRLNVVELWAGDRRLIQWPGPPYAFDVPLSRLQGFDFVRATAIDATGFEATDLVYLDGSRYVEQVDVNLVELPVIVSDAAGAAIPNLAKESFSVFEDGKPKPIEMFGYSTNLPLSVGVLVDHSGSMEPRIEKARQAAVEFFSQILKPGDKAFFGGFSFSAKGITPFVSDLGALRLEIDALPGAEGGTALYDAIISGLYRFRSVTGRKALIVVTDGEDTASRTSYEDMLRYVRSARVPVYFIGIGLGALDFGISGRVKSLAAETGATAYFIKDAEDLQKTYAALEAELRSQYLLGYYTETSRGDRDYRTVEVKVNREGAKVRTIRGFIP